MSITGAGFLAGQFRDLLAEVKKDLAGAGEEMAHAISDLKTTAEHAMEHVAAVRKETADLKAAIGLASNGGPPIGQMDFLHATPVPPAVLDILQAATHDDTGAVQPIKLASGDIGPS